MNWGKMVYRNISEALWAPETPGLILDGHSSHESLAIHENALANELHILSLPQHNPCSSASGPCCVWSLQHGSNYMSENVLNTVNKWGFPGLVKLTWETSFTIHNIQSAFRACEIYPFDRSVVLKDNLLGPSKPTERDLPDTPATPTNELGQTMPVIDTFAGDMEDEQ